LGLWENGVHSSVMGMIRRLLFAVFFVCGGFLFYIPKWIAIGTRGERERKKILRELRRLR
jgi:hypothetical protein